MQTSELGLSARMAVATSALQRLVMELVAVLHVANREGGCHLTSTPCDFTGEIASQLPLGRYIKQLSYHHNTLDNGTEYGTFCRDSSS